ncbi:MAG: hypothetical protein ACRDNL_07545 [Spirillospora sp.]
MGVDGLEAIIAEHASLEARLAGPSVHRDFRLARRLRRCLEALEPPHTDALRLRGLRDDLRDARDLARAGEPATSPTPVPELNKCDLDNSFVPVTPYMTAG